MSHDAGKLLQILMEKDRQAGQDGTQLGLLQGPAPFIVVALPATTVQLMWPGSLCTRHPVPAPAGECIGQNLPRVDSQPVALQGKFEVRWLFP